MEIITAQNFNRKTKLSVLVAFFNEAKTIFQVLDKIEEALVALEMDYELVLVNDGSTDLIKEDREKICSRNRVRLYELPVNQGKGAALRFSFPYLEGEITLCTDADLEYSPKDFRKVLEPILKGEADHVIGSRYGFDRIRPPQYWFTFLANYIMNLVFGWCSGHYFKDMLSGLFSVRTEFLKKIQLQEDRFSFVPEFYWKLIRLGVRFAEVPIEYHFRTYREGKKVKPYESLGHLWSAWKYRKPK